MKLSRIWCPHCQLDTIHKGTACLWCKHEHVFPPEPMNEAKAARLMAIRRKSRKGAAARNAQHGH